MSETVSKQTSTSRVLVADDEQLLVESYEALLSREHDVQTATTGAEALEILDDSIDVAILDRRMPDWTGDEVLGKIRDRNLGCRVILCTGIEPDYEVFEMKLDDYLVKPVSNADIRDAVERQLVLNDYGPDVQEYYALEAKRRVLDGAKNRIVSPDDQQYERLEKRLSALEESVDVSRIDHKLPA